MPACGTSFAAPIVTHSLAALAGDLGDRVDANVLRAFPVHFAERHRHRHKRQNDVGYGRFPLSYDAHLSCGLDEVHVLFQDKIERGEILAYELPVPPGEKGEVEVTVTIVCASPVEPSQPTEYTQAALELKMRPNERVFTFTSPDKTSSHRLDLDEDIETVEKLLADNYKMSREPVTHPLGTHSKPENLLRDSGKWETVRHHAAKLDAVEIVGPRLEVSYLARRSGGLNSEAPQVDFALLVTMKQEGNDQFYEQCRAKFDVLVPIDEEIQAHASELS